MSVSAHPCPRIFTRQGFLESPVLCFTPTRSQSLTSATWLPASRALHPKSTYFLQFPNSHPLPPCPSDVTSCPALEQCQLFGLKVTVDPIHPAYTWYPFTQHKGMDGAISVPTAELFKTHSYLPPPFSTSDGAQ